MPLNSTRGAGSAKGFGFTGASGPAFIEATGGTVLTCGDFKTHIFTGNGNFVVSSAGKPSGSNTIEYLVVAGGGGGGARHGGGGGAGGFRTTYPSPATGGLAIDKTTYPITIGGGGAGGVGPYNAPAGPRVGTSGTPSSIGSLLVSAGGGSGSNYGSPSVGNPDIPAGYYDGGSGGGSGLASNRGEGNTPPTSPPQGFPGGPPLNTGGSGGGGAAAIGNTPGNNAAGAPGGVGSPIADAFFGPTAPSYGTPGPAPGRYFAGGGGGGGYDAAGGSGGAGGGGNGVTGGGSTGGTGTTNTGGGAGGSGGNVPACGTGGVGGTGFVAIRYKFK
jgi:hypothetical protein